MGSGGERLNHEFNETAGDKDSFAEIYSSLISPTSTL